MCHSHANNRKINMLHERCLRIVYHDRQSAFIECLSSVSIHIRNIQKLAIEMFEFYNVLSPPLMNMYIQVKRRKPLQPKARIWYLSFPDL